MPVIGHAFIGWATFAAVTGSKSQQDARRTPWIFSAILVFAYAPDIATQALQVAGFDDARGAGHSAQFALALSAAAFLYGRLASGAGAPAFALAAVSVWLHNVADVLQGAPSGRWWPIPGTSQGLPAAIPDIWQWEALIFGAVSLAVVTGRVLLAGPTADRRTRLREALRMDRACAFITCSLLLAAAGTHIARTRRDADLESARALIATRQYSEALARLEAADRWPTPGKAGRIDYHRAESYLGLGDRDRAEHYFALSLRKGPAYFWALADQALFFASGDGDQDERRRRVAPLVARLRRDFANHDDLPRFLERIERHLDH